MSLPLVFHFKSPPRQKRLIPPYIDGQLSEFFCNIDFKKEKKIPEPRYSKNPLQIFLWLDAFVMSAWLQSRGLFWLDSGPKSARIPSVDEIPSTGPRYFPDGDYSDWTIFPGLPSYNRGFWSRLDLPGNSCQADIVKAKVVETFCYLNSHPLNWCLRMRIYLMLQKTRQEKQG